MDSRWRFLHCARPEDAGTRARGACRAGEARRAARGRGSEEGPVSPRAPHGPKKSREERRTRAEKSRYGAARARTADRHRWMGRGSSGRREKHCQGTRQNGPVT